MRRAITKTITDCTDMLEPLQLVDGDLDSLDDWLDDAEHTIESHQHTENDFETQHQIHEVDV